MTEQPNSEQPEPEVLAQSEAPEVEETGTNAGQTGRDRRLTVVGIGASAGGLAALQDFFQALDSATLPDDTGMAFVVVTHMDPERESLLPEILQKHTMMPVHQVQDLVDIEPNYVYVIPPGRRIFITDTHLSAETFDEPRGRRTPVDDFFRSLAAAHRQAVAIILSGGGTDGAVGVKAVKEEGGLLIVQEPAEAEHDSMPRAAMATGLADVVLPASELAQKLVEYHHNGVSVPEQPEALTADEQEERGRIAQVLHDDLQQQLYALQMRFELSLAEAGSIPEGEIEEIEEELDTAIETARQLSVDLSPPILNGEGLTEAMAWLANLMAERHRLRVEVEAEDSLAIPDLDRRVLLFQSVRELLFNVVKHAGVTEALVRLQLVDEPGGERVYRIDVFDKGVGFDPETVLDSEARLQGRGLRHIRQRLGLIGGRLEVTVIPDEGTRVTIVAPPHERWTTMPETSGEEE